jgi:hypothetical protein
VRSQVIVESGFAVAVVGEVQVFDSCTFAGEVAGELVECESDGFLGSNIGVESQDHPSAVERDIMPIRNRRFAAVGVGALPGPDSG